MQAGFIFVVWWQIVLQFLCQPQPRIIRHRIRTDPVIWDRGEWRFQL